MLSETQDMGETEFVKAIVANLPEEELTRGFACMDDKDYANEMIAKGQAVADKAVKMEGEVIEFVNTKI